MMNPFKSTVHLRERLLTLQRELIARASQLDSDKRREKDPLSPDAPDRAIQLENDQVVDAIQTAVEGELRANQAALARIDEGSYGICLTCMAEIDEKRLAAVPYAEQCQSCAAQANS